MTWQTMSNFQLNTFLHHDAIVYNIVQSWTDEFCEEAPLPAPTMIEYQQSGREKTVKSPTKKSEDSDDSAAKWMFSRAQRRAEIREQNQVR